MTACGCACHADFPGEPGCPQQARVDAARRDALTEAAALALVASLPEPVTALRAHMAASPACDGWLCESLHDHRAAVESPDQPEATP